MYGTVSFSVHNWITVVKAQTADPDLNPPVLSTPKLTAHTVTMTTGMGKSFIFM